MAAASTRLPRPPAPRNPERATQSRLTETRTQATTNYHIDEGGEWELERYLRVY